jgi:hypothetical protein
VVCVVVSVVHVKKKSIFSPHAGDPTSGIIHPSIHLSQSYTMNESRKKGKGSSIPHGLLYVE